MTFSEYVAFYGLTRSEGLVLRYLSDGYKALRSTVPEAARTEELVDLTEWLGEMVRQTDSSLLDEWEQLTDPDRVVEARREPAPAEPRPITSNERAFRVLVRNAMFRRVELAARRRTEELAGLDAGRAERGWTPRGGGCASTPTSPSTTTSAPVPTPGGRPCCWSSSILGTGWCSRSWTTLPGPRLEDLGGGGPGRLRRGRGAGPGCGRHGRPVGRSSSGPGLAVASGPAQQKLFAILMSWLRPTCAVM
jgi:hypothetical protein